MFALVLISSTARAEGWHGSAAAGGDFAFVPEATGFGFVLFDATGEDKVGKGDVRLHYNTDTIHLAIERVPMGENFEFSVALRGEIFMAGLLHQYYQQGLRRSGLGFNASYVVLMPKIQWHVANQHTLEVLTDVRYWMFVDKNPDPAYLLPANAWVFEPRLGYIYWNVDSPGEEYRASKLFPRIEGIAVGASVGVDVRSDVRSWGFVGDGRNDPTKAIWTLNQWLRAGWQTGERFRLELQETANWGWNQDDLTRMRVGGMNPYVVIVPGLPWSANISERLLIAQLSGHIRPKKNKPQELGLIVSGGALNDPRRQGLLDEYDGVGGLALFTDLRWGRWQVYARVGWAFPTQWLLDNPHLSGFVGLGVDAF
ncbi:MAG: hypothetical protein DRH23_13330 [Deltaproteobacteria bacterium]|nr:MAG: hypothetical protein DRH23_13330 [Deltaproteobacteria bacterium]